MSLLDKVFNAAVTNRASDIHVVTGEPFILRRVGKLIKLKNEPLSFERTEQVIHDLLDENQIKILKEKKQLDFAVEIENIGRFRGSTMMHQKGMSAVFRVIPDKIPTLEELTLPPLIEKILDNHQGLILITGATGHGKTTTLAAMTDYINANRSHHILTIEDPIEFVHPLKKGVVNQRQILKETLSYGNALKGALRQDPDVIIVGELRDLETIALAISASETGHLVIATLSTSGAAKTIDRVIDSFPAAEQSQIRAMLSESVKAVITQRLIPATDNKKMVLALEILIGTQPVANLIRDGKTFQIHSMMQTGKNVGMQLMDESIAALYKENQISEESAKLHIGKPALLK